ncbi:SLBB domain-containing protein [Chloroflexota bacterium]
MAAGKVHRYWTLVIILLLAIIVSGGLVAWLRYHPEQPVEISLPRNQKFQGMVYLGGAVANPGFYPLSGSDTIDALIQAAGGTIGSADLSGIKIYFTTVGHLDHW